VRVRLYEKPAPRPHRVRDMIYRYYNRLARPRANHLTGHIHKHTCGPEQNAKLSPDFCRSFQARKISISRNSRLNSRRLHIIQVFSEVPYGICCKLPFNDMQLDTVILI
jgi:hypothetical protein